MRSRVLPAIAALLVLGACSTPDSPTASAPTTPSFNQNPNDEIQGDPKIQVHLARGQARPGSGGISLLLYHNGAIMTSTVVKAIFWGQQWSNNSFVGDKITGLASFYSNVGGTNYMRTNAEYYGTNGSVGIGVTNTASVTDLSPAPRGAPKTSEIQAEVCKMISQPVANGYYPVYVDTPRGQTRYCAWHSYGSCNGTPVQFAFFFNLDGDRGCDPGDNQSGHSQGLAALANVSGHELSEAVTDPRNGGWWDSSGAENSDKCAWTFGPGLVSLGTTQWKIQGNWSNAAVGTAKAYDGAGCIAG
jgi:hypothetical protein